MNMSPYFAVFSLCLCICLLIPSAFGMTVAKPNCMTECGDLTVPYPFGLGIGTNCSIGSGFDVYCDTAVDPPRPYIPGTNLEILDIRVRDDRLHIKNLVTSACYDRPGSPTTTHSIDIAHTSFTLSDANKFMVVGCDDAALIIGSGERNFTNGCVGLCSSTNYLIEGECSGIGCCQTAIPKGRKSLQSDTFSIENHRKVWEFNRCGYAFLGDPDSYRFTASDLNDTNFPNKILRNVPVVLDWAIGTQNCTEARNSPGSACLQNSFCIDSETGRG